MSSTARATAALFPVALLTQPALAQGPQAAPAAAAAPAVQPQSPTPSVPPAASSTADERLKAVREKAAARDPKSAGDLAKALDDSDPRVRASAVEALGLLRAAEAAPRVQDLLAKDPDADVRRLCAGALGLFGAGSEEQLIKALGDASLEVRVAAADSLGSLRSAKSAPAVSPLLKDKSPSLRRAAAAALGRIQSKEAAAALRAALEDEDALVRREAAKALIPLADPDSASALRKAATDTDLLVRVGAAAALCVLAAPAGEDVLARMLKDSNVGVRQAAAAALGAYGPAKALAPLAEAAAAETDPGAKPLLGFAVDQLKARFGVREDSPRTAPNSPRKKRTP